jgi:hypothetical protein
LENEFCEFRFIAIFVRKRCLENKTAEAVADLRADAAAGKVVEVEEEIEVLAREPTPQPNHRKRFLQPMCRESPKQLHMLLLGMPSSSLSKRHSRMVTTLHNPLRREKSSTYPVSNRLEASQLLVMRLRQL